MAATTEPLIRDATPDDAPAMLEVIQSAFPNWPPIELDVTPLEHLRWKMSSASGLEPDHAVVVLDDRVVGTQLRWKNSVPVGGREFAGASPADLSIHPDFQGRGLSRHMDGVVHDALVAKPQVAISMLGNAPQIRHMNWPDYILRPVTNWYLPFRLTTYVSVHLRDGGPRQLARSLARRLRPGRRPRRDTATRVERLERFDDQTDALWESARGAFDIICSRQAEYLNWRFASGGSSNIDVLGLFRAERLIGYTVVRRSWGAGQILDLLWMPEESDAFELLIDAAVARLRATGARDATCWLPAGHCGEPALRAASFAMVGEQTLLCGSPSSGESPPEALAVLADLACTMHVTMSDFDHV